MDRRAVFGQITGAGAAAVLVALPQIASADGASAIARSKGIYGSKIDALKKAVDAGDINAVIEAKGAFILYNSGAYPGSKNKGKKAEAIAGTNAVFAAAKAGDKAALKKAYSEYVASNDIHGYPDVKNSGGQGYSTDSDYKNRSPAGSIYIR
jgi:hypothetical protein